MEQKKNIDQLFKERFAQHEVSPPGHVWEGIQAGLKEKKKDRIIIPLWWKVGGIAAAFAVLFTIANSVFTPQTNSIVTEEIPIDTDTIKTSPSIKKDLEVNTQNNATPLVESTPSESIKNTTETTINETSTTFITPTKQKVSSTNGVANTPNNTSKSNTTNTPIAATGVANTPAVHKQKEAATKKINNTNTSINGVATVQNQTERNPTKTNPTFKEKNGVPTTTETTVANTTKEEEIKETVNKPSIFDAIEEQKVLDAQEVVAQNNAPSNRWEVAPNFAPVYYNTLSEGSSIDQNFADNSQSGDVNLSYGVQVSYALNKRLKVRTGVHNVDLSYSTGGLELGDGPVSAALRSVDYNRNGTVVIAQDQGTFSQQNDGTFGNITPKSTSGEAFINQNINYLEVPLELSYALVNNRFGVNVIGGLSTLFLGNNEISVTDGDFSETLGSANNLSNVSFATNVGLGMYYNLSQKFKFNVEPMFKYQVNPYTDSSVDFQPFYMGVYTGLSFKF